jgi:type II secretory pathway component GspD/PulD (secretin)
MKPTPTSALAPSLAGVLVACSALLTGCATRFTESTATTTALAARQSLQTERRAAPTHREDDGVHVRAIPVEYVPPAIGAVTLALVEQPLAQVIAALAAQAGFAAAFAPHVDARLPVSLNVKNLDPIAALREAAFAAGLVAVVDRTARTVTLAREGLMTFRVPAKAIRAFNLRYSMASGMGASASGSGGTGATSAGGGTSAGAITSSASQGAGGSSSGSGLGTTQVSQTGGEFNPARLIDFLRTSSGADIAVLPDHGFLTGRGNATQLRRLNQLLEVFVRDALTQVEVELSMIDVAVASDIETGIDWNRIIGPGGIWSSASGTLSLAGGSTAGLEGGRVAVTTGSINAVIKALERVTQVEEIVRPRFVTENHRPAVYQSLERRPFVPSAQTTVTPGVGNVVQTSATVEYFQDGVEFTLQPDVIDSHRVSLTLRPTLQNVRDVVEFKVARDITLSAPRQPLEQALVNVIGEHNKTLVIAGLRSTRRADSATGVPGAARVAGLNWLTGGTTDRQQARDLVMLVHTRIIPAPTIALIVGESL